MKILFTGLEPCPRNRSHTIVTRGKFAQNIKTEAARLYEQALKQLLKSYASDKDQFIKLFNEDKHGIKAEFSHGTPSMFTAAGKISQRSVDLDAHKVLKDVIFEFIGLDDSMVIECTDRKFYSPHHVTIIDLEIVPKGYSEVTHEGMVIQ